MDRSRAIRAPTGARSVPNVLNSGESSSSAGNTHHAEASFSKGSRDGSSFASNSVGPSVIQPSQTFGRGGGAHRSVDESLQVDAATGTFQASYTFPITPGRGGFNPVLNLEYDSGIGNGPFGRGWRLTSSSISRQTTKFIPKFDDGDVFVLSGNDDLVSSDSPASIVAVDEGLTSIQYRVQRFRPRTEDYSQRIECWTNLNDSQDVHWKVLSAKNVCTVYGFSDASRVFYDGHERKRIFCWLPCESYDTQGNAIQYTYKSEDASWAGEIPRHLLAAEASRDDSAKKAQKYLKSIRYGNLTPARDMNMWDIELRNVKKWAFEVVLDYGEHNLDNPTTQETRPWLLRHDPFSTYSSGFEVRTYRLCRRVLMFHHFPDELKTDDYLTRSISLDYEERFTGSLLQTIQSFGHMAEPGSSVRMGADAPHEFSYSQIPDFSAMPPCELASGLLPLDTKTASWSGQWVDLDGEGAPGILHQHDDGSWAYQRNLNAAKDGKVGFAPPVILETQPLPAGQVAPLFTDLDRNGCLDLVWLDTSNRFSGYAERKDAGWLPFTPFLSMPNLSFESDTIQAMDLTGNGLQDLLSIDKTTDEVVWHECLAKVGFGAERRIVASKQSAGPVLIAQQEDIALFLADMTGDGLDDIVHISNTCVKFWPNTGYGTFGSQIVMGNNPRLSTAGLFSSNRVLLADIDGSGTADMLYFPPSGGVEVFLNELGNSWSERSFISAFPKLDNVSYVGAVDLLGNGTSCLCWIGTSKTQRAGTLFYIDFAAGTKSHLMTKTINNRGLETTITYRPSTYYYQNDLLDGQPWLTKLPMPVHCVDTVTSCNKISSLKHKTVYVYHDGHYDPAEWEFRGFGMVEVAVSETLDYMTPNPQNRPWDLTKNWFNVGAAIISLDRFHEAFPPQLENSQIPQGLSNPRLAHRALKGRLLRREVYSGLDNSHPGVPLLVEEKTYTITLVQPSSLSRPAVFAFLPAESIKSRVEGEQNIEPCRTHDLVVEVNEYGQILKSVSVAYGNSNSTLPHSVSKAQQEQTTITATVKAFTHTFDQPSVYRHGLLASESDFQVLGMTAPVHGPHGPLFRPQQFLDISSISEKPGITLNSEGSVYKVLARAKRQYYRNKSLDQTLKLGEAELFSVLERTYQLCLTPNLINDLYTTDHGFDTSDFAAGGHTDLDEDGRWWAPSDQFTFSASPSQDLEIARQQFYMPTIAIDPFGYRTISTLDPYCLKTIATSNAVGSIVRTAFSYAHLEPTEITDSNENRQFLFYDVWGQQVGQALAGKAAEKLGDSPDNFDPNVTMEVVQRFFENPSQDLARALLGSASSRNISNCLAYFETRDDAENVPLWQATLSRDRHSHEIGTEFSVSVDFVYYDGHGSQIQDMHLRSLDPGPQSWQAGPRVISNAQGDVLRRYHAFFQGTHSFSFPIPHTVPVTTMQYDILGRNVVELGPDHTWAKTRFSAWQTLRYDAGDTILSSDPRQDQDVGAFFANLSTDIFLPTWHSQQTATPDGKIAADKSAVHDSTPQVLHLDSMGRVASFVKQISTEDALTTRATYDIHMGKIAEWDGLDRLTEKNIRDLSGRTVCKVGMDFGERRTLLDCRGRPQKTWNSRDIRTRLTYDALGRLCQRWIAEGSGAEKLIEETVYGEKQANALRNNLHGQVFETHDQSGSTTNIAFDFKGNLQESTRQFCQEYKRTIDWNALVPLESVSFRSRSTFDAKNRLLETTNAQGSISHRIYGISGHLEAFSWKSATQSDWVDCIRDITYTADGLKSSISFGNTAKTQYQYDENTRNVLSKRTVAGTQSIKVLEDKSFMYDCMGKMIKVDDAAQQDVFFRNAKITPSREFTYNALGQLIQARGRAHQSSTARGSESVSAFPGSEVLGDGDKMYVYEESYEYNKASNFVRMRHQPINAPSTSGWSRQYFYEEPSFLDAKVSNNRLSRTQMGKFEEVFGYRGNAGIHGCMTSMPGYSGMAWDHDDRLRSTAVQNVGSGVPETTWYVYDRTGSRVRKITVRPSEGEVEGRKLKETLYLSSLDIFRKFAGDGTTVKSSVLTCSIGDVDSELMALMELFLLEDGKKEQLLVRYQIEHGFEVDDDARIISYEEYSPYGRTVFALQRSGLEAPSKYRYASYMRDNETGLYYCQARYYAPWLGRWVSSDPIFSRGGLDTFCYSGNDPVNHYDPEGTMHTKGKKGKSKEKKKEKQSGEDSGNEGVNTGKQEKRAQNSSAVNKAAVEKTYTGAEVESMLARAYQDCHAGKNSPVSKAARDYAQGYSEGYSKGHKEGFKLGLEQGKDLGGGDKAKKDKHGGDPNASLARNLITQTTGDARKNFMAGFGVWMKQLVKYQMTVAAPLLIAGVTAGATYLYQTAATAGPAISETIGETVSNMAASTMSLLFSNATNNGTLG